MRGSHLNTISGTINDDIARLKYALDHGTPEDTSREGIYRILARLQYLEEAHEACEAALRDVAAWNGYDPYHVGESYGALLEQVEDVREMVRGDLQKWFNEKGEGK